DGLVGGVGVDRASEVARVVGDHAERISVYAGQRGDHPVAKSSTELEYVVEQRVDHSANVVDPLAVGRDQVTEGGLVFWWGGVCRAAEVPEVAPGGRDRLGVVLGPQVDDAVCVLDLDRADLVGGEGAEAAALDHRGTAHADA